MSMKTAIFDYGDGNKSVVSSLLESLMSNNSPKHLSGKGSRFGCQPLLPYATPLAHYGFTDSAFTVMITIHLYFQSTRNTGLISIIDPLNFENGQGSYLTTTIPPIFWKSMPADTDDPDEISHLVYLTICVVEDPYFVAGTDSNETAENLAFSRQIVFRSDDINEDSLLTLFCAAIWSSKF